MDPPNSAPQILEADHVEKTFLLELQLKSAKAKLEIPMQIPFDCLKIPEFAHRIISSFQLPIYVENEVEQKLREFVEKENFEHISQIALCDPDEQEDMIKLWEQDFRDEILQYNPPEVVGDDEVFAEAYHSLVHSPLLGSVLRKENAFNSAIREMHRMKNLEITSLNEKQTNEMSNRISQSQNNSSEINALAAAHFDDANLVRTRWESIIESDNLKQKREFREWIVRTYEDYYLEEAEAAEGQQQTQPLTNPKGKKIKKKNSVRFDDTLMISYDDGEANETPSNDSIFQESFTIHLGSQMKQMYNIRVLCNDPIEYLRFKNESSRDISPQRLQMAISLYSADLSGIVILVEPDFSPYSGITKDIVQLCQQTTEFHYDTIDTQLENRVPNLKTGDFLITKHSNLNGAHVIFHLVVDQNALDRNEINSRDPVILGLRNILKIACLHDITTITVPALLSHDLAEFMTVQWCTRRAELVYKCVKGFMIEMTSWSGADMKNLQFLAPKGISESVFNSLAAMLPNIFRVSNPLRLSSSSSNQSLQI